MTGKAIAISLASLVVVLLAIYLLHAFAAWEINPGNWSDRTREGASIVAGMLGLCALIVGPLSTLD